MLHMDCSASYGKALQQLIVARAVRHE